MTKEKKILIADDDADMRNVIASRCRQLGLTAVTANDATTALQIVEATRPDLICLDVSMPRGNGLAVCELIAGDEALSSIPVIIMTGKKDKETVQRCHNLCAYYVLKGQDIWSHLEPLIRELLKLETSPKMNAAENTSNQTPDICDEKSDPILDAIFSALGESYFDDDEQLDDSTSVSGAPNQSDAAPVAEDGYKPWILHVDDDKDLSDALKVRLEACGVSVVQACDGMEGVRHAFNRPADAIILDYHMPHGNGEYVLSRLKQCRATKNIPIIVLTGRRDQGLEQQMLSLGADRFLSKPIRFDTLLDELRQIVPMREPRGKACLLA